MTDQTLRDRVFASCDRAVENGYATSEEFDGSIYECQPSRVAVDLLDADGNFEAEAIAIADGNRALRAKIVAAVAAWQDARRPR